MIIFRGSSQLFLICSALLTNVTLYSILAFKSRKSGSQTNLQTSVMDNSFSFGMLFASILIIILILVIVYVLDIEVKLAKMFPTFAIGVYFPFLVVVSRRKLRFFIVKHVKDLIDRFSQATSSRFSANIVHPES